MTCLRCVGGGQSDLPASVVFSDSFSLKYTICQSAIFQGCVSETPSSVVSMPTPEKTCLYSFFIELGPWILSPLDYSQGI